MCLSVGCSPVGVSVGQSVSQSVNVSVGRCVYQSVARSLLLSLSGGKHVSSVYSCLEITVPVGWALNTNN